jgi:hypothetical protein
MSADSADTDQGQVGMYSVDWSDKERHELYDVESRTPVNGTSTVERIRQLFDWTVGSR